MARIYDPSSEQREAWDQWVAERPPEVQKVAGRFNPWTLYRLGSSGHRVQLAAFDEEQDGRITCRVSVDARFNFLTHERVVFGIDPAELTECDLPGPEEPVGNLNLSIEECRELLSRSERKED